MERFRVACLTVSVGDVVAIVPLEIRVYEEFFELAFVDVEKLAPLLGMGLCCKRLDCCVVDRKGLQFLEFRRSGISCNVGDQGYVGKSTRNTSRSGG